MRAKNFSNIDSAIKFPIVLIIKRKKRSHKVTLEKSINIEINDWDLTRTIIKQKIETTNDIISNFSSSSIVFIFPPQSNLIGAKSKNIIPIITVK
jgi:hypothetical protein